MTLSQFLLLVLLICVNFAKYGFAVRTKDKMYEDIDGSRACFRRLNATHQIGCTSERGGTNGVIHYCESQSDLNFILKNGTAPPYVPIIPTELFTADNLNRLKNSKKVSGLVVFAPDKKLLDFTHENQCPNPSSSVEGTCGGSQPVWNPYGTGLLYQDMPFPIFLVENDESITSAKDCFKKHNNHSFGTQRDRSLCSLQLNSFMYATTDTPTCIRRSNSVTNLNPIRFCEPLGDQNVWASLFPLVRGENGTEPIRDFKYIVVAARLDTTSMFEKTAGAISPITGMVTLLSTAKTLKSMLPKNENYKKNVLFVLFNGETYDYIGSQRFLYELLKEKFPTKSDNIPLITIEDINLFVELSQLNKTNTLVAHYLNRGGIESFLKNLKESSGSLNFVESPKTLPPGSLHTFLKNQSDFPGLILTDHKREYANPFYNSIYDNGTNLNYRYHNLSDGDYDSDSIQEHIFSISEAVSKSLYQEITGTNYPGTVRPDLRFIDELFYCYLENGNCKIHQAVRQKLKLPKVPLSLYVGVERGLNFITTYVGLTLAWVTGDLVGNSSINCTNEHKNYAFHYYNFSSSLDDVNSTKCYRTSMNFTEAVSPAFIIDDYDWTSGQYSTWSESTWNGNPSIRMFLKPSAAHETMTIAIGSMVFIFSLLFVYFVKSRSDILFAPELPTLAPTNC